MLLDPSRMRIFMPASIFSKASSRFVCLVVGGDARRDVAPEVFPLSPGAWPSMGLPRRLAQSILAMTSGSRAMTAGKFMTSLRCETSLRSKASDLARADEGARGLEGGGGHARGGAEGETNGLEPASARMYSTPPTPRTLAISWGSHTAASVPWSLPRGRAGTG